MAKADGATVRSNRDAASLPAKITPARQQRVDSAQEQSIELIEIIETERSRLMKAQAILNCALVAMECEGNANAPYYPDVLQLAQELVNQSIDQLDSLRLRPMIRALERAEPTHSKEEIREVDPRGENELRDSANVIYIVSPNSGALS